MQAIPLVYDQEGYPPGELSQPMDLPRVKPSRSTEPGILNAPPEDTAKFDALVEEKWSAKMPLLFKHFGIQPDGVNAWRRLAYVLAAKHVPGFFFNVRPVPPPETRGRKKNGI
jgi:hypothetical protein